MKYKKHIFICTNQRGEGQKKSCGQECGMNACEHGPALVVYPEGVFYGGVQESDISQIIDEHILNDRPVERLVIDFSKDK